MGANLTADMKRVVNEQRLAFVATVCPDGTPNLSPKGTIAVWDDTHLVFADIRSPKTISNLELNSAIEINVVDPFARKGYRFKGTGELVSRGELFNDLLSLSRPMGRLGAKPNKPAIKRFVLVTIEKALPLISPAYDNGSDEKSVQDYCVCYFDHLHAQE